MTLKVIGAGFGRTGTASLKLALEKLLGAPCYHMSEVLGNAGHVDRWLEAAAGKPDWDGIFGGYAATVDFPASNYWRELMQAYPEAKVILSKRDARRWALSTQATIFSKELQGIYEGTKWGRMLQVTIDAFVGGDINDEEAIVAAFNRHNEEVIAEIDPARLLVFEAKDGWAPLAHFLGVEVPAEPYPHINSKEEFDAVFGMLRSPVGDSVMDGQGIGGASMHEEIFEKP